MSGGGGAVVWITGLPSSGKTTFAQRLRDRVGPRCVILDGDAVRAALRSHEHAAPLRDAFYMTLARLAALLAEQGLFVLVPATANRRAHRLAARQLAPRFVEVYIRTPLDECRRRDPKGLYARAQRGEIDDLPGVQAEYEPPQAPDVVAEGGEDAAAVERAAHTLL